MLGSSVLSPHRKAIEGLVALSEDGCSPISIQQMAYGECCAEQSSLSTGQGARLGRAACGAGSKERFLVPKLAGKSMGWPLGGSELNSVPVLAVAGVGFGLMSGAFSMINLLADALGPGTVGIHGDSQLYFLTSGE